ncbi:MAG TPA: AgmX/PglI C-terminal domain-containing protein, partial [Kofleriaceae bacterium]
GGGILMGMIGLIIGVRGSNEPAPAPAPIVQQAQPAAAATPVAPQKIDVSLDADIANARVVFRRRVHQAPTTLEINATDVVELVEVSATGYKTTRYWLTFDRPTYLKAHLVKGTGSIEATEEETLAALGEVIMVNGTAPEQVAAAPLPVQHLPAAAMPAAASLQGIGTAKTLERPPVQPIVKPAQPATEAQVALAPRKIGRAAAESEPAVVAATEPPPVEAKVEAPVVEPTKQEEPKLEPAKPVAETVAKQEPKVEASEDVLPSIDRATVSSVISTHRPEVLKCFAEGKKKNPAMKGTLSLQLQVNGAGAVHRVQVQSTLNNPLVAACVVKAATAWKFPSRNGGELATVAYPFTIN